MLHSRKLQYIDEIARCGSIRKAASHLNVASSAVNRQILALEDEIGAQIFERLPRGLRLTATGELYVEHIRDVLKDYDRLEARVRGLKMPQIGKVSMGTTVGLAAGPLPAIIARFLDTNPRVRVVLHSDSPEPQLNPVLTGEVDIGLGFNLPPTPGIRSLATFEVPLGVVVASGNTLAGQKSVQLSEIIDTPMVLARSTTSLRDVINLALAPLSIPVEPIVETNSMELLKQLVKTGNGITFMNPLDVYAECQRNELVYLPIADSHVRNQPLRLFTRSRATLDATASMFVEYLITALDELIAEIHSE